jgi:ketosteroid isomerase-like protein
MNDRRAYIKQVEAYFSALDARRLDEVLACFNDDAVFTVQSAFITCAGRDTGIRGMFQGYLETWASGQHTDFEHIVDPVADAISSRFRVELDGRDGTHQTKQSVNHFYLRDGRFQRVYVWISGENVLAE